MSGPIPAPYKGSPASVVTASGSLLVISGAGVLGDPLVSDGPGLAHWGAVSKTPMELGIGAAPVWWFKADSLAPVADGTMVGTWTDSTSALAATSIGAGGAVYRTAGPKGKPYLDFAAAGGYVVQGLPAGVPNDFTVYMVIRTPVAAQPVQRLFGNYFGPNYVPSLRVQNNTLCLDATGSMLLGYGPVGLVPGAWTLVLARLTGVGTVAKWDIAGNVGVVNNGPNSTVNGVPTGLGHSDGNEPWKGDVAEVGLFKTALTDGDLASLKAYLYNKYFG